MDNRFNEILNNFKNMTDDQICIAVEDAVYECVERRVQNNNIIKAGDLTVGCKIAESDGYLFDVIEVVEETAKTITVRLASDFSSIRTHWAVNGGVLKTFRKSKLLCGVSA